MEQELRHGQEWKGPARVGGTGPGTVKWRGRYERGGQRGEEGKKATLVGGVQEY